VTRQPLRWGCCFDLALPTRSGTHHGYTSCILRGFWPGLYIENVPVVVDLFRVCFSVTRFTGFMTSLSTSPRVRGLTRGYAPPSLRDSAAKT